MWGGRESSIQSCYKQYITKNAWFPAKKKYEVCKEMGKHKQQKFSVFCESDLCQI